MKLLNRRTMLGVLSAYVVTAKSQYILEAVEYRAGSLALRTLSGNKYNFSLVVSTTDTSVDQAIITAFYYGQSNGTPSPAQRQVPGELMFRKTITCKLDGQNEVLSDVIDIPLDSMAYFHIKTLKTVEEQEIRIQN